MVFDASTTKRTDLIIDLARDGWSVRPGDNDVSCSPDWSGGTDTRSLTATVLTWLSHEDGCQAKDEQKYAGYAAGQLTESQQLFHQYVEREPGDPVEVHDSTDEEQQHQ